MNILQKYLELFFFFAVALFFSFSMLSFEYMFIVDLYFLMNLGVYEAGTRLSPWKIYLSTLYCSVLKLIVGCVYHFGLCYSVQGIFRREGGKEGKNALQRIPLVDK